MSVHWGSSALSPSSCASGKGPVVSAHDQYCSGRRAVGKLLAPWGGIKRKPLCILVPWCCPYLKMERTQPNSSVSSQHFQIQRNLTYSHRQYRQFRQELIESCRPSLHQKPCSYLSALALLHQTLSPWLRVLVSSREQKLCITPLLSGLRPILCLHSLGWLQHTCWAQEQSGWIRFGTRRDSEISLTYHLPKLHLNL